jgi:hypothetical protein
VYASWNTFYATALVRVFPSPIVLGSYLNLAMAACALALVIVAVTRRQMGYGKEAGTVSVQAAAAVR